jgi:hypothetical protein
MAVDERTQSLKAELQEAKEKLIELAKARQNHESMVQFAIDNGQVFKVYESLNKFF